MTAGVFIARTQNKDGIEFRLDLSKHREIPRGTPNSVSIKFERSSSFNAVEGGPVQIVFRCLCCLQADVSQETQGTRTPTIPAAKLFD